MKNLQSFRSAASRSMVRVFVVAFALAVGAQALPATTSAAQLSNRKITMSSSAPSATGVTYTATFTPGTSLTNPDVIIDFCSNSPVIGDSCTATAGTDVPNMSSAAASGYTVTTIGSNRGIKLTTSTVSYTSGTPVTITITGVVNPSNNGTFYGRILTYTNGTAGSNTSASPGSPSDTGGVAMSTSSNITITSKVFETLSYCVFQTSCGTAPQLTLGDPTTGALSTSNAYVNSNARYTLATNASGGANVTMTGTTLCRTTGSNCLTGASAFTITAAGAASPTITVGSEQFGMCVNKGGSSVLTVPTKYNDSANNCGSLTTGTYSGTSKFGFDDSATTDGTNSAGGSQILSSTAPVPSVTSNFGFFGNIAPTTEAGIYTTVLNTVATGTF